MDGNAATSGLQGTNAPGGFPISEEAYQRFCYLRDHYGKYMTPPLTNNVGITPGPNKKGTDKWIMDGERMVDFGVMTAIANNPNFKK
jgi:hypothetical protein